MRPREMYRYYVKNANQFTIIDCHHIRYCTANDGYTVIYTEGDEKYMESKSLTKFMDEIGYPYLIRISQSVAVNIHHIKHVRNKEKCIILENGTELHYTLSYNELQSQIKKLHNTP